MRFFREEYVYTISKCLTEQLNFRLQQRWGLFKKKSIQALSF